ncbi:TPA: CBS domain-containing protein [archaeon]|nr:CBS domain-containing protein [Candidatus Naiadarchaeales archaeon SRR2090153.bin461]
MNINFTVKNRPKLKAFAEKVRSLDFGPREFSHHFKKKEGSILSIAHREIIPLSKVDTIKHAADKMTVNRVRRLYILGAKKNLEGMVSATDIVNFLGGGDLNKIVKNKHDGVLEIAANEPIRQIMTENPITISGTESMHDALIKMHSDNVGSLPIVEKGKVVGVVTERDFVPLLGKYYSDKKVADYMTRNVITGSAGMAIGDIAKVMIRNGFRRLPIIQDGELTGVVSTIDIVNAFSRNPTSALLETKASEIMNRPFAISEGISAEEAADIMAKNSVGGLMVVSRGKLIGVFTERDLLRAAIS